MADLSIEMKEPQETVEELEAKIGAKRNGIRKMPDFIEPEELYKELINSNPIVVVEFYASWCPHCQKMMPVVDQIKQLLGDKATVHQFDIDENQSLADATGVESIPTFIIYKNGVEVWRQSGEMEGDVLYSKIENYL